MFRTPRPAALTLASLVVLAATLPGCGGGGDGDAELFLPRAWTVDEYSDWRATFTPAGGAPTNDAYREQVTATAPAGTAIETTRRSDGRRLGGRILDVQERMLSLWQIGYDDAGNRYPSSCNFDPPVPGPAFPLQVGKTWSGTWATSHCIDEAEGGGTTSGTVEAREFVEVPAGRYDALRIRTLQSTDVPRAGALPRSDATCWWSVERGRFVKCETTLLDFATGRPTGVLLTEATAFGGP